MNIRQLKVFKTLCEELNFTKTAERLNMTQPAVSHVVNDLEQELKTTLFDRINRKIYLTSAGKLFLNKTIHLLELYDDIENSFIEEAEIQPLHIGSCLTIANFWLPDIARTFRKLYPQTKLLVTIDRASNIESMLTKNEIDLALYEGVVPNQEFCAEEFSAYEIGYFVSPLHPLANEKDIPLNIVLQYNLLLREKGSAIRETLDSTLLLHNLKAEPNWTSVNSQALVQGAIKNNGISVIPEIIVQRELSEHKLVKLNVAAPAMINHNYIIYHPEKFLTPQISNLIEVVRKYHKSYKLTT